MEEGGVMEEEQISGERISPNAFWTLVSLAFVLVWIAVLIVGGVMLKGMAVL
jgi:hypothetical protein